MPSGQPPAPDFAPGIVPAPPWSVGTRRWDFTRPLIMGVLNATPDSFSDGGQFMDWPQALARARTLTDEGADIIDLGGASSHPRARPVPEAEELERVLPIVERLVREVDVPLSIDTQRPAVADACLALGMHLINDVSGLTGDAMARVAARHDTPLVITYNNLAVPPPAGPETLVREMLAFFRERIALATAAGAERLILDPGYGFGKSLALNLAILREIPALMTLNRPVLVCTSRKGSLGRITGETDPANRLGATLASSLFAVHRGATLIRVHDVQPIRQGVLTWQAVAAEPAT